MLCLVRDEPAQELLATVREYLVNARPNRVPHAWYEYVSDKAAESAAAPETPDTPASYTDLDQVAKTLFELAKQLSSGGHKKYGRIGFRRFELVRWLMHLRLDDSQVNTEAELARQIRRFELAHRKRPHGQAPIDSLPIWARVALWLVPPLWFGLRLRIGVEYRWFLRQSFLAPHDPGTFLGFALRLTGQLGAGQDDKAKEDPEQLLGLLVNAFLEDVRRAYRRRWWRPRAARRTTYPVILLDRITRQNGGYRLLEAVNRVRNETGLFDPLLFITGSRKVPPEALPPVDAARKVWGMGHARAAYDQWRNKFAGHSRARKPAAWYLPLQADAAGNGPEILPERDTLEVPRPPVWARTSVRTGVAVALAVAIAAGVVTVVEVNDEGDRQWSMQHCGLGRDDARAKYLVTIGNECIGLSAEPVPLFQQSPEMLDVQKVVASQNIDAERLHRETPDRPFVTVAYLSEISASGDIRSAEVERMQGVAARQRRQLDGNIADPLVRILFTNAGREMRHGPVAAGMLAQLMAEDETFVGAVGLAVSSKPTVDTIRALGAAGIPMIAAPLTADGLENESPLYFQVSPQNRREAQMAAKYARHQLRVTGKVVVVSTDDPADLYSTTLTTGAVEEFGKEGFPVEQRIYTPSPKLATPGKPSPRDVGQQLCGLHGLVFYTGRPVDFAQLLDGINGTCSSSPPAILAGDDVSRYVADAKSRERYPQVPFDHVAIAPGGQNCYSGGDLSNTLQVLFPERCASTRDSFLTDDAATAYDALTGIVAAVNMLRGTKITPGAVWHKITRITGSARIDGASGVIDYGRDGSQIPLNKFLTIMRIQGLGTPVVQATCGEYRDRVPARWCP